MKKAQRRMSELPFLKWYPYLAAASLRWQSLSLTARGLFRELYDLAARQTPRGAVPGTEVLRLQKALRISSANFGTILAQLIGCGLIDKMLDGTLVFPDWNRHQRDGSFRNRGTDLAQNWHDSGTLDVDEDKERDEEEDAFDVFWRAYPSKVGKKAAQKAWDKAKDKPDLAAILAAVNTQKKSKRWREGYIPNPATWLNQGRWSDEAEPASDKTIEADTLKRLQKEREQRALAFSGVKVGCKAVGPEGKGIVVSSGNLSVTVKVEGYGFVEIVDLAILDKWKFT